MKPFPRLVRENAKEYALRVIKENIITWELVPGELVSEKSLSEALGVSRAPIREALQELDKSGIITIYPQRGTVISEIDFDRVKEAEFLRRTVECAVIEEACSVATEEDFQWFEKNLALQELYWSSISPVEQRSVDKEFHKHLYEITKKMQCYEAVQSLSIHFDRVRYVKLLSKNDINLYKDHLSIFEAIRERNPQKAIAAEIIHLSRYQIEVEDIERVSQKLIHRISAK
nr:GntR family transcriptional regulator [Clostridia bacterium]